MQDTLDHWHTLVAGFLKSSHFHSGNILNIFAASARSHNAIEVGLGVAATAVLKKLDALNNAEIPLTKIRGILGTRDESFHNLYDIVRNKLSKTKNDNYIPITEKDKRLIKNIRNS